MNKWLHLDFMMSSILHVNFYLAFSLHFGINWRQGRPKNEGCCNHGFITVSCKCYQTILNCACTYCMSTLKYNFCSKATCVLFFSYNSSPTGIAEQILCTSENQKLLKTIRERYKHSDVVDQNAAKSKCFINKKLVSTILAE